MDAAGTEVRQLDALTLVGTVIALGRRARQAADAAELRFILVNETHQLAPYRQAVLWLKDEGVVAFSGVAGIDANAPLVLWLNRFLRALNEEDGLAAPRIVDTASLAAEDAAEWTEWLPASGVWLPLRAPGSTRIVGGLLLAREAAWQGNELALLGEWSEIWSHAYDRTTERGLLASWRRGGRAQPASGRGVGARLQRWRGVAAALAALAFCFFPVHLSVLAPGELVPLNPSIIRSPLDGVVERVLVVPNQSVAQGQPLFEFDRAGMQSRLEVARQALASTYADSRLKGQRALFDAESKAQLAIVQTQIAERRTEVAYLEKINRRGVVESPRAGLALFDDATEWIGRPVTTGERIMVVADAASVEVEAWLAPSDAIELAAGSAATLYLNAAPLEPVKASLSYVAHEASERPDGSYAYRVRAAVIVNAPGQRVGLKGTVKLEGERVTLAYWVLRRPLAGLRGWLGV